MVEASSPLPPTSSCLHPSLYAGDASPLSPLCVGSTLPPLSLQARDSLSLLSHPRRETSFPLLPGERLSPPLSGRGLPSPPPQEDPDSLPSLSSPRGLSLPWVYPYPYPSRQRLSSEERPTLSSDITVSPLLAANTALHGYVTTLIARLPVYPVGLGSALALGVCIGVRMSS